MNAAERVHSYTIASKLGAIANLFKSKFPAVVIDLKPWVNSPQEAVDPDSLDIGFTFPGISRLLQAKCILFQIRLHKDPCEGITKAIGIEALAYNYRGQCWRFSTIANWEFWGEITPIPDGEQDFRQFCHQVLDIFNAPQVKP